MTTNAFEQAGRNLAVVIRAGEKAGEPALARIGVASETEIKRILSQPGRGRTYRRGTVSHRASAPGDPPAVDLGHYRASWSWVVRKAGAGWELLVGTPSKLGPWLEYGTSRMAARPHLRILSEKLRASSAVAATVGEFMMAFQERASRSVRRG